MFNNSTILITGGTGSFGHAFVELTLKKYNPRRLIIFSRDEMKQWEMAKKYPNEKSLRFFIGDVRDKERLHRALKDIDYVVHAAATKIVPTAPNAAIQPIHQRSFRRTTLTLTTICQICMGRPKRRKSLNTYPPGP